MNTSKQSMIRLSIILLMMLLAAFTRLIPHPMNFTAVLAIAGVWLVMQLADLRKNQDCVLSGRRNCAPIDVKAMER